MFLHVQNVQTSRVNIPFFSFFFKHPFFLPNVHHLKNNIGEDFDIDD
jgi:hypothetical protein